MTVMTVGLIHGARQAESIVRSDQADMVALGRGMLFNPHWTWQAAVELGARASFPVQSARSHPALSGSPVPGNPPASAAP